MSQELDIARLREWIGAVEVVEDDLTVSLAERFHRTLGLTGEPPQRGDIAPGLIHFCLCQPVAPTAALGKDGHPPRGGFMPAVPLPRRMWAASDITFHGDLRVGATVRRHSVIEDVVVKHGRTGPLCFVTVSHNIDAGGTCLISDRQTIVYRNAEDGTPSAALTESAPAPQGAVVEMLEARSTLLFRYSALTFNGHRIHYDLPYATDEEGYPGLVVQGPLQATLLFHLAMREAGDKTPASFSFRSMTPLFDRDPVLLHAATPGEAQELWTSRPDGPIAMKARAQWASA